MFKSAYRNRREGFSLIAVLIIGLVGLAMIAAAIQMTTADAGVGRSSSNANARYNLLSSEIEKERAKLKEIFENPHTVSAPPRRASLSSHSTIANSADLLIDGYPISADLSQSDLARYGISGKNGELTVCIYDILYEASEVDPSSTEENRNALPQSLPLSAPSVPDSVDPFDPGGGGGGGGSSSGGGGSATATGVPDNAGSYLIRTSLKVDGANAGSLSLALVLSNKEHP
jgi:hypothetical protein